MEYMDDLFLALFLLTIPVLIVGLIKPAWLKMPNRKVVSLGLGGAMVVFLVLFGINSDNSTPATVVNEDSVKTTEDTTPAESVSQKMSKEDAQKELDELMSLSIKAGLVTSYKISDTGNIVYVGPTWYTQTAIQKKDFLAYVANLKEAITGYRNFRVQDAYTDEVVAEFNSLGGDFKIYK